MLFSGGLPFLYLGGSSGVIARLRINLVLGKGTVLLV